MHLCRYVYTGAKIGSRQTKESQLISVPSQWNRLIGVCDWQAETLAQLGYVGSLHV